MTGSTKKPSGPRSITQYAGHIKKPDPVACEDGATLKQGEYWMALLARPRQYTVDGSLPLLGQWDRISKTQVVYYQFGSLVAREHDKVEHGDFSTPKPIEDLSGEPAFQRQVRAAMDDVQRIGNIRFMPAPPGHKGPVLNIGQVDRWPIGSRWERTEASNGAAGFATHPQSNGSALIEIIRDRRTDDMERAIKHEIGHALGLNHPRNYPATDQPKATVCDAGKQDVAGNSIMSYNSAPLVGFGVVRDFGEDDVKAIQDLYGKTKHSKPYVPYKRVDHAVTERVIPETIATRYDALGNQPLAYQLPGGRITIDRSVPAKVVVETPTARYSQDLNRELTGGFDRSITVSTGPADDHLVVKGSQRVFYDYQGGADTVQMTSPHSTLMIGAGGDQKSLAMQVTLPTKNTIDVTGSVTGGKLKIQIPDVVRHQLSGVRDESFGRHTPVSSRSLDFGGDRTLKLLLPAGVKLELEVVDSRGQQIPLPVFNPVAPKEPPMK